MKAPVSTMATTTSLARATPMGLPAGKTGNGYEL